MSDVLVRDQRIEVAARFGEPALCDHGIGAICGDDVVVGRALARHELGEGERTIEHRARRCRFPDLREEHAEVIEGGEQDRALRAEQFLAQRERFLEHGARLGQLAHEVVANREVRQGESDLGIRLADERCPGFDRVLVVIRGLLVFEGARERAREQDLLPEQDPRVLAVFLLARGERGFPRGDRGRDIPFVDVEHRFDELRVGIERVIEADALRSSARQA